MMPARRKFLFSFLVALMAIFLFWTKRVFAQVVINEFAAVTGGTSQDPDWVELYSLGDEPTDLSGWLLRDSTESNKIELSGLICPQNFRKFDFSNRLNNGGDSIRLFDETDGLLDQVDYFSVSVPVHDKGESTGRNPDGSDNWIVFSQPTPFDGECFPTPTPTPTPSLSPTPTPTPTPSLSTAKYKINEVKDKDGNVLSNVKIYIDGVYVHHYAPETLTFCGGCQCGTYVDCGFGDHTIKLEKSDYED